MPDWIIRHGSNHLCYLIVGKQLGTRKNRISAGERFTYESFCCDGGNISGVDKGNMAISLSGKDQAFRNNRRSVLEQRTKLMVSRFAPPSHKSIVRRIERSTNSVRAIGRCPTILGRVCSVHAIRLGVPGYSNPQRFLPFLRLHGNPDETRRSRWRVVLSAE